MKRKRLFWQLYPSFLWISLLTTGFVLITACLTFRSFYFEQAERDLEARALLLRDQISSFRRNEIQERVATLGSKTGTRFTVIRPDGEVIADSNKNPSEMDNHRDRPEIAQAFDGNIGTSTRFSHTIKKQSLYVALPLEGIGVVRASFPVEKIQEALMAIYSNVLAAGLILVMIVAVVTWWISRKISRPLEGMRSQAEQMSRGEFSARVRINPTDPVELASLGRAINDNAIELDRRVAKILKERNEKDAILSSMVEGVLAIDRDARVLNLNAATGRLLGLGVDLSWALGKPIQEVVRVSEVQRLVARIQSTEEVVEDEISIDHGSPRYFRIHGSAMRDENGERVGGLLVFHDVTRLRILENHRKEFVGNVAHELRTPLTSVQGFVETLMDGVKDESERKRFLGIILRHSNRLNSIIEDLLLLSRIEDGATSEEIALQPGPVLPLLRSAVELCQLKADRRGIAIELDAPEDLKAQMNRPLLEQAVVNLVDNAIKYSEPDTSSKIRVFCRLKENEIRLGVQDQGRGIAPEHLPRLFERFYRVDKARSRDQGGTGLGLSIVKHIALAHGGKPLVRSEVGKGSTFELVLRPAFSQKSNRRNSPDCSIPMETV